jgi:hypothetical protein
MKVVVGRDVGLADEGSASDDDNEGNASDKGDLMLAAIGKADTLTDTFKLTRDSQATAEATLMKLAVVQWCSGAVVQWCSSCAKASTLDGSVEK